MERIVPVTTQEEKTTDPFLESLWSEYNFPGKPPFSGSIAEKRLRETCDKYADLVSSHRGEIAGVEREIHGIKKISSSENQRRELHNQIAVMVVGKQRSGMSPEDARNIAEFAYEFSRGYKISDEEKYEN